MSTIEQFDSLISGLTKALDRNKEKAKKAPYQTVFWKQYFQNRNAEISKSIKALKSEKAKLKKK